MTDRRVGRIGRASGRKRRAALPAVEGLEGRALLAAVLRPGAVIDVSRLPGSQSNASIAINPLDPNCIAMVSENFAGGGLVASNTLDGGLTWSPSRVIADGFGVMVPASGNPEPNIAFDEFGNLFLTYVDFTEKAAQVALSVDCGASFKCFDSITSPGRRSIDIEIPDVDRPAIATGAGSVWVTLRADLVGVEDRALLDELGNPILDVDLRSNAMVAAGARVTGLDRVGRFGPAEIVPEDESLPFDGPFEVNFGSVAIGPAGQVIIAYQDNTDLAGESILYTSSDPDGLGPGNRVELTPANPVLVTSVGGEFYVPTQRVGHIDAEVGLAYDLSDGPNFGRLYMVYTDGAAINAGCTDIFLIYSDDDGAPGSWSDPGRVTDNPAEAANFNPKVAVDRATGNVGVSFYSARNDPGFGPGDRDGRANNDVELFATVSTDGGLSFAPNVQVAPNPTSSEIAGQNDGRDLGRYTGLAFFNNVLFPAWADNSVGLVGNPEPNLLDIAVARVQVFPEPPPGVVVTLTAQLDPASDTGASAVDTITNINRPTFFGTTNPGATVEVVAQSTANRQFFTLGRVVAGPDGGWRLTSAPLPDGPYVVFATAVEPIGGGSITVQVLPDASRGPLVIDTVGPKVSGLEFDPRAAGVRVSILEGGSGLDPAGVANPAVYRLTRGGSAPIAIRSLDAPPPASGAASRTIALTFAGGSLRGTGYQFVVSSTGLRDLAGNPLDGEFFGYFPSGDATPGGDFAARLDSFHGSVFPAESLATATRTRASGRAGRPHAPARHPIGPRARPPVRFRHRA